MRRVSGRRGTSASGPRSTTASPHRLSMETTITTVSSAVYSLEPRAGCVTSNSLLYQGPSPNFPWSVSKIRNNHNSRQECIPVGCVPPAAVAVGEGRGLHQADPVADLQKSTLHPHRPNFFGTFLAKYRVPSLISL